MPEEPAGSRALLFGHAVAGPAARLVGSGAGPKAEASGAEASGAEVPGAEVPGASGPPRVVDGQAPGDRRLVVLISYLMGPAALVVLLGLRRFGVISREPVVLYLIVFAAIPLASAMAEAAYRRNPTLMRLHARMVVHVAAVATVIYMTGWGPVLTGAYMFIALESISRSGARAWRPIAVWSLVSIVIGQVGIWYGFVPSALPRGKAETLGAMGVFVLMFVIRMAGAASEEKERAESAVRTSEDRFRSLVQNSSDTTLVLGSGGVVTYASSSVVGLLGTGPGAITGRLAGELLHPEDREAVESELTRRLSLSAVADPIQFRVMRPDGQWRHVEAIVTDLRERPSVGGYVANIRDITERKEAESLLAHQALHDPLTGLPNRVLLVDRLRHAIARAERADVAPPVVMFLDLDRFKLVNDSLGHGAGDVLLMEVSRRLESFTRTSDTVARFGGDEFVILCEDVTDQKTVSTLAQRIMKSFEEPFTINDETFHIGISIGVASVDEDFPSAEELLSDADFAMYLAKARIGPGQIQMFDQAARASARQRIHTETALARALERRELEVFYQPVVEVASGRWAGTEALVRWHHPTRGLLGPSSFLEVAEQTGMIVPIGTWVLGEACAQVKAWNAELVEGDRLSLSVNLSARQLAEPGLVGTVTAVLAEAGIDLGEFDLCLEMTESLLHDNEDLAFRHLVELDRLGIGLAIDDFGTGYSSLRHVRELPVSAVKIDQSFVSGLGQSTRDEAIVKSVVQLAKTLGLRVVAEGVRSALQARCLENLSCDYAQGYIYGQAEPADEFWHSVLSQAG